MVVMCCLVFAFFVLRRLLIGVGCLLFVIDSCSCFVVCCFLLVVGCLVCVVWCLWVGVCGLVFVIVCFVLFVAHDVVCGLLLRFWCR